MLTATKDDTTSSYKGSSARDTANEAKQDLREVAHNAGQKARDFYNTACDEVSHVKGNVTTQIRTNPVQSSFIALGLGFVLGALFRR